VTSEKVTSIQTGKHAGKLKPSSPLGQTIAEGDLTTGHGHWVSAQLPSGAPGRFYKNIFVGLAPNIRGEDRGHEGAEERSGVWRARVSFPSRLGAEESCELTHFGTF